MQSQDTLELCIPDNIRVSYIDNNSSVEEAARRAWEAMKSSHKRDDVQTYYTGKQNSENYIEKEKIEELMEYLASHLVLKRPEDPIQFLIESLGNLKSKRQEQLMSLTDVNTMFDLIDINSKGSVTPQQLIVCMENLQIPDEEIEEAKKKYSTKSSVDKNEFSSVIMNGLNVLKNTPWV
jgi:Ca2+-binding EF-hand superfamily protein